MAETTGNQYHRPGVLRFDDVEWDSQKAESNLLKHEISFAEAVYCLLDPNRIEIEAPQTHGDEQRWMMSGVSEGRLLTVIYTWRERNVRIISARKASRVERREYRSS